LSNPDFLAWIYEKIGMQTDNISLYEMAFTHGSLEAEEDYQRLEFLGDRVLGLCMANKLYRSFPDDPEGKLSQRLNRLVSGACCAEIARKLGISEHLRLGKQAHDDGARNSNKVLGDVMESMIGALYLDQGFESANAFILRHWQDKLDWADKDIMHPKSRLQEWAAEKRHKQPEYRLIERSGPDHDLRFTVAVKVQNVGEVQANSSSKQTAETEAARKFLEQYL